ncbi:MAG: right-handed parallel beta-helix repeat-containing protein, partial [Gemmatimonadota bacterium]|nr:right-handed parallel beta-helix repeat-containing protein [Gemmatimonadota bacterium]
MADLNDLHMSRRDLVRWSAGAGTLVVLGGCGGLEDLSAAVTGPPAGTGKGTAGIAQSARAAVDGTFYVDSLAGDDANPGNDSTLPWRSLGRLELAVGAGEIGAGDTVQFRAGSTFLRDESSEGSFWFEAGIRYRGSDISDRPVFVGSGDRPFGVRGTGTALRDLVLQGGDLSVLRTDGTAPVHVSLTNVDCTGGARIGFQQLSGAGAGSGSTFTIKGGSFSRNGTIGINLTGAQDTTVDGVEAADNGTVGIRLQSSGPGCVIRNCAAHGNGANGIGVDTPRPGGGAEVVEGNTVYRNAALLNDRSGIKTFSVGTVIRYNEVFENGLDGNLNHGIQLEAGSSDAHCYANLCFGNRTVGISFTGSGHRLYHNTCDSN